MHGFVRRAMQIYGWSRSKLMLLVCSRQHLSATLVDICRSLNVWLSFSFCHDAIGRLLELLIGLNEQIIAVVCNLEGTSRPFTQGWVQTVSMNAHHMLT
jgi:hypothetical protein